MINSENERSRSRVLGMRVISISEGLELGQVTQILIDQNYRVSGFSIRSRRGREERRLPLSCVSAFGEDRITIERQEQLTQINSFSRQGRRLRGPLTLVDARVFTDGGRVLGKVEDYAFQITDGSITALELSQGRLGERLRLPGRFIIAIAPQTVMIKGMALEEAVTVENGLRAGLASAREKAGETASSAGDAARKGMRKLSAGFGKRENEPSAQEQTADEDPANDPSAHEEPSNDQSAQEQAAYEDPAEERIETEQPVAAAADGAQAEPTEEGPAC